MYVLIEHAGTEDHLKIAETIQDFAEDRYGCTCETVVGDENGITLYNDSLEKFANFIDMPSEQDLGWYFNLSLDTEE
tara:strand:- start:254 stop:484 length:231 start_codon:yes stop_codon:yes gene_type:complete